MAEGGVVESNSSSHDSDVLDLEKQKEYILERINKSLAKGETWYLLDSRWFTKWKNYVGANKNATWEGKSSSEELEPPGPIDNCLLLSEDETEIKKHLIEELDYQLVPEECWQKFVEWYGLVEGQQPIPRGVIEQGTFVKHYKVEIYLMELKLCENSDMENVVTRKFSRASTIADVTNEMRKIFEIEDTKEVRIWNKYMSSTFEMLNKPDVTIQDASLYTGGVLVIENQNEDGTWPRQAKSTSSYTSTRSTDSGASGYGSVSRYGSGSSMWDSEDCGASPGLCGLSNLGNTCFMNSALQCMSNVPPLTKYFLHDDWEKEVNEDNPLGMRGEIARSYAELIRTMWCGKYNYTAPRNFKYAVGRFAPQFSGFQQQDSQELMAFLLDGLHEDLNRIRKKPYVEIKDADGRPDKIVAQESWDNYRKRNDSVIVDTFHGLLKSTVHCPQCQKISVTFDPFCYLSLPLPVKKERNIEVFWVPVNPSKKTVQYKLTVPKMGIVSDLCAGLSEFTKVSPRHMIVTDVYSHRFHKIFSQNDALNNILDRDDIFVYELPSDFNEQEMVFLSIYMREKRMKNQYNSYQMSSFQLFGQPLILALPIKCTYQVLYNQFLQRISRMFKMPEDAGMWWKTEELEEDNNQQMNTEEDWDKEIASSASASVNSESEQKSTGTEDVSEMETSASSSDREMTDNNASAAVNGDGDVDNTKEMQPPPLFTFQKSNSYGSADSEKLKADGTPLKLQNKMYIAVDWHPAAKEKFYDQDAAEALEQHESVNLKPQKRQTIQLDDCLELFTKEEELGANDLWYCPQCKKHQQATKKFDLWKLPDILIVHLKRFSYNRYYRDKIDTLVEFPQSALNLKKYIINPEHGPTKYDLIAVTNHFGGLGGGHYTAFGKNVRDGEWYYFDDSSVSSANNEDQVVSKAAYVLVYQKQGMSVNSTSHPGRDIPATVTSGASNGYQNGEEDDDMET